MRMSSCQRILFTCSFGILLAFWTWKVSLAKRWFHVRDLQQSTSNVTDFCRGLLEGTRRRRALKEQRFLRQQCLELQHRNPSRMLNSGNIFFTILIWFWIRFDDMNLICFEFGVMISIWFWYGFDTILIRFWYDFDMILIRFWYGSSELASKKETETAQG